MLGVGHAIGGHLEPGAERGEGREHHVVPVPPADLQRSDAEVADDRRRLEVRPPQRAHQQERTQRDRDEAGR